MNRISNSYKESSVFIIATPIGNMGDITDRAIETLKYVDLIYAEDTRQTSKLLGFFNIKKNLYQLHKHNEIKQRVIIEKELDKGNSIAIVSDAGTPLISDPGYKTLSYLRERNHSIYVVPGCSAVIAALSISGLQSDNFQFIGFVPSKKKQRFDFFKKLVFCDQTTVFFEAPHRIVDCINDCFNILGEDRKILIARELTKQFEETELLKLSDAVKWISSNPNRIKGEFVLVLESSNKKKTPDWKLLTQIMFEEEVSTKGIASIINKYTGENKKDVYNYALSLQNNI